MRKWSSYFIVLYFWTLTFRNFQEQAACLFSGIFFITTHTICIVYGVSVGMFLHCTFLITPSFVYISDVSYIPLNLIIRGNISTMLSSILVEGSDFKFRWLLVSYICGGNESRHDLISFLKRWFILQRI